MAGSQFAGAAERLPFRSSFETGNFSDWNGGLEASMSITAADASDGRYSTQAVMTLGQTADNYKEFLFGDHLRVGGVPVTPANGLWLSFDSKFDSGFTFGSNTNLHKIALINFEDENARRRYQIIINVWISTGEYFVEHLKWNADRSFNRSFPGLSQNVGTAATVRRGQWDRLKLFIRPNTPGATNGVVQLWVNGVLKVDRPNITIREDQPYNPNKLLMVNYVNDTTTVGVQKWDNFYLGESDPDQGRRPNPPVIESVR